MERVHTANFYDSEADLISGAATFLSEGLRGGEVALAVATEAHRDALAHLLAQEGLDVAALEDQGLFVPLDAPTVVRRSLVDGTVDRDRARQAVLPFAQAAAAKHRPMRCFGEAVGLLWQAGDVHNALLLEEVRNEVAEEYDCALHCAYPSRLVQEARSLSALTELCAHHDAVVPPASYDAPIGAS